MPQISAKASMVMDVDSRRVLWQKNPDAAVPIASITKLMNVLVWFDHAPADKIDHIYEIKPEDDTPGGKEIDFPYGEKISANNLLHSALIASYNDAALALSHTSPLNDDAYIQAMNTKAHMLNMNKAHFADQTGLDEADTATPADIALLAREAFRNTTIQEITQLSDYDQETTQPDGNKRFTKVITTNTLLYDDDLHIIGAKTGYTEEAGYCLVVQARDPQSQRDIIVVVLGAPTDAERFTQAKQLIQWTFEHYDWTRP